MPFLNTFNVLPDQVILNKKINEMFNQKIKQSTELNDKIIEDIKKEAFDVYKKDNKLVDDDSLEQEINEICGDIMDNIKKTQKAIEDLSQSIETIVENNFKEPEPKPKINRPRNINNNSKFKIGLVIGTLFGLVSQAGGYTGNPQAGGLYTGNPVTDMLNAQTFDFTFNVNNANGIIRLADMKLGLEASFSRIEGGGITEQDRSILVANFKEVIKCLNNNKVSCSRNVAAYYLFSKMIDRVKKFKGFNGNGLPLKEINERLKEIQEDFNKNCDGEIDILSLLELIIPEPDTSVAELFADKFGEKNNQNGCSATKKSTTKKSTTKKSTTKKSTTEKPTTKDELPDGDNYFYDLGEDGVRNRRDIGQCKLGKDIYKKTKNNSESNNNGDIKYSQKTNNNWFIELVSAIAGSQVLVAGFFTSLGAAGTLSVQKCSRMKKERKKKQVNENEEILLEEILLPTNETAPKIIEGCSANTNEVVDDNSDIEIRVEDGVVDSHHRVTSLQNQQEGLARETPPSYIANFLKRKEQSTTKATATHNFCSIS